MTCLIQNEILTAVISFHWKFLESEGLMLASVKPKRVASSIYSMTLCMTLTFLRKISRPHSHISINPTQNKFA
jgi:hypothetical protein